MIQERVPEELSVEHANNNSSSSSSSSSGHLGGIDRDILAQAAAGHVRRLIDPYKGLSLEEING
jgi:hypothetical protein